MEKNENNIDEINDRIKIIAKTVFGSLKAMDKALGKKQGHISTYMSQKSMLGGETLQLLAERYDVNINWLLTGKGSMLINDNENAEVINSENKEVPILTNRVALELIEELRKAREERQLFRVAEEVVEYKA